MIASSAGLRMTVESERISRILDVAEGHFLAQGFAGARIDAIAAEARVSKREIYAVWPSKDALFLSAVRRLLPLIETGHRLPAAEPSARKALLSLGRDYQDAFLSGRGPDLLRLRIMASREFPKLAEEIHSAGSAIWAKYGAFEELVERGAITAHDPHLAGIRFGGLLMEGTRYVLGGAPPSRKTQDSYAEAAVDFYLYGYRNRLARDAGLPTAGPFLDVADHPAPRIAGSAELRLPQEKRDALFDAAMREFANQGYYRAKLSNIARLAGVSSATIYRHFKGKEDLFPYVLQRRLHELSRAPFAAPDVGAELNAAVEELCRAVLDRHLDPEVLSLHRLMIEEATRHPKLARDLFEIQLGNSACALRDIARRYALIEPDEFAIRAFHALATLGPRFLIMPPPPPKEREALSREAARIVLHGARGEPSPGSRLSAS